MRLHPKSVVLKKSVMLYRRFRYRKGFGVHSPFVYNLITRVIEEPCQYYKFDDIELERRKLMYREGEITYPDRQQKGRIHTRPIAAIVEREAISPKRGALLFRLANYFKSRNILQLGPAMGISTLYLTSYAPDLKCIAIEGIPEYARIASEVFEKASRNPIDLRVGGYRELFPQALADMGQVDFIFFNTLYEQQHNAWLFTEAMKHVHPDTVFVFDGIRLTKQMKTFWKEVCARPEVTVTIDLYSIGLVFFNPKLHKRNYKVYF